MHFLIVCRRHTVLRSLWSIFKALPTPMPHSKHSNLYTKKLCPLTTWSVLASEHARTVSVMKHSSILHIFHKKQRYSNVSSLILSERINRGHDSANVKEAILKAKSYGLKVCGHLIFGLPGETKEMMLGTVNEAYALGIDSVKYHPLYVVKRTALANEYARGDFDPISEELYVEVLKEAILLKPKHVSVQRISAGTDDETLIAPLWCKDKNAQLRTINATLKAVGLKY